MNAKKGAAVLIAGAVLAATGACSEEQGDSAEVSTRVVELQPGVNGPVAAVQVDDADSWLFTEASDVVVACAREYEPIELNVMGTEPESLTVAGKSVEYSTFISPEGGAGFTFSSGDLPGVEAIILTSGGIVAREETAVVWPQTTDKLEIFVAERGWISSAVLCMR
ncbi:MAG: hypothetical protein WBG53_14545 [Rhodococcus sp. (in: high G+C Gram-positive bacteria)]|uniref:hypothetical protein n=1 Tax=unclassified Rhodococcus (in: high G+C Gram-positive bacteria) TaxID=192944 RepID=UPI000FFCC078|nr:MULTISPECIES: hypothetical protein [unclassified Rhodococcus (in: high G+C Gram-positive bacteria)]